MNMQPGSERPSPSDDAAPRVTIDVVSDVVCPWCFLGKRRLDRALADIGGIDVTVRWRPYQLDPTIPREGIDRQAYLTAKFGAARLAGLHDPLIAAGAAEGVPYRFDAITCTPNTLDAHRLIRWAHADNRQHVMAERLFMAYWSEGKDVGDRRVLLGEAIAAGLDGALVSQLLASAADLDPVIAEINQAREIGVTGVPTFIFGSRYAVVGAQPAEVLKEVIEKVAAEGATA